MTAGPFPSWGAKRRPVTAERIADAFRLWARRTGADTGMSDCSVYKQPGEWCVRAYYPMTYAEHQDYRVRRGTGGQTVDGFDFVREP